MSSARSVINLIFSLNKKQSSYKKVHNFKITISHHHTRYKYGCIIVVLSYWSETNLNTLLIMTCQTLQMWAKAKSIFFCFHKKGHCIYFLRRTESNCVWSISICLWETYLVVKSKFNGYFILTLGRPAMSVGSTHIRPRDTNWTLLDVSNKG